MGIVLSTGMNDMDVFAFLCLGVILLVIGFGCKDDFLKTFLPKLVADKPFQHMTFAVMLLLFLLWNAQAGVKEGLYIHFLALTTLTMMFGWRMAFLLTLPVYALLTAFGDLTVQQLPSTILLSSLAPILFSYAVFVLSYHYLPRNIFVFIFIAGFFNAGLTGSVHLLINALYHLYVGHYDWQTIWHNYFIFMPLLAFPEALLNGMSLAVLCVFKPEWLRVFSDRDYIYNHYRK
ncbi:TPA: hypothetical protein I7680_12710 [Vibrio vulnificus]|nr:hypothetical protein AL549_15290 [Vibrio vulnificus]EGR0234123.1 hypothetical protein [Vibrio vulnificus]PWY29204.1 hypothetical protein VV97_12370 [Vibrio vulnificus]RZQ22710.1 hypothetical protein D8T50_02625 [Vibrio vulnificus]RZR06407.1 hypothetical protein D8T25_02700 [Vibrio vulnificus]